GAFKNKVREIIQRHEIEMKRGEITGAGNLKALGEVSQVIAEALADGTIDAYALVELVGHGRKAILDVDGVKNKIVSLRDKLGACVAPDPKEFYDHFDSPEVMKDALKKHLEEMKGIERACFASLFSDAVLKAAGMGQEDIIAARKQAHQHMYTLVSDSMRDLAQKSKDELIKLQVREEDIDTLIQIADRIEAGDKQALKNLVDGRGRVLLQNILGVAALQELQGDKNAWTDRVKGRSEEARAERHRNGRNHGGEQDNPYEEENRAADRTREGIKENGNGHYTDRHQRMDPRFTGRLNETDGERTQHPHR
ncbi:MAG: hypothetical protein KGJ06_05500, partial [Pseudomonadota bacterium]|nr:hypothetical protein [Pseudomonadota bacterium]